MAQTLKRNYRATFILDTRNYEEPVENLVSKLENEIKEMGGEVQGHKNLGNQDFVRVTNREHTNDSFVQIDFSGPPESPSSLQDRLRLDKTVKRILVESR